MGAKCLTCTGANACTTCDSGFTVVAGVCDNDDSNASVIIGAVIGVLAALGIAAAVTVYFVMQHKKKSQGSHPVHIPMHTGNVSESVGLD